MKFKAIVIEEFGKGPSLKEFPLTAPGEKEVTVKMEASGICGSDLHIFEGKDPRIKLPLIPGHEGTGKVFDLKGEIYDVYGNKLKKGDRIIWDRGITCENCQYCTIEKKPFLCEKRKVYGINFTIHDNPFPNGCHSEFIKLASKTKILKISEEVKPEILVAASCSGATAYHSIEESEIKGNETVLIQGPGPIGMFLSAFCKEKGIEKIIMTGSSKSKKRMELARKFGVSHLIYRDKMDIKKQIEFINELTDGKGVDIIFEAAGAKEAVETGQYFLSKGGKYIICGIAVPSGKLCIQIYENLVRKNATYKGIWVSDTSHLISAVNLILKKKYPFDEIVNGKFSIFEAREGIESVKNREIIKSVFLF